MATSELKPTGNVILDSLSRFRDSSIYQDPATGIDFFETYTVHTFPIAATDLYHEVGPGEAGRLDLIAFRYYNNPSLWWILADANSIAFPLIDVVSGTVLRVPDITTIQGFS